GTGTGNASAHRRRRVSESARAVRQACELVAHQFIAAGQWNLGQRRRSGRAGGAEPPTDQPLTIRPRRGLQGTNETRANLGGDGHEARSSTNSGWIYKWTR